jgi:hypothetical protein
MMHHGALPVPAVKWGELLFDFPFEPSYSAAAAVSGEHMNLFFLFAATQDNLYNLGYFDPHCTKYC